MSEVVHITAHAIERYQERVDAHASWLSAHLAIRRLLSTGRSRPTPRHWMRRPVEPGTTFVYNAWHPDVCVIVAGGTAVTVVTRELNRAQPRRRASLAGARPRQLPPPMPMYVDDDLAA
jgi:hypothetical protein